MKMSCFSIIPVLLMSAAAAPAAINIPTDGSDGVFHATGAVQIDLGLASTAKWDEASTSPGKGIYDPEKWAVMFKYQSVMVDADSTVTFKNHPSGAPVVWLVNDDVSITGSVVLNGQDAHPTNSRFFSEPGPGGFRGGVGDVTLTHGSSGFGPGGGRGWVYVWSAGESGHSGGTYGTQSGRSDCPPYGNARVIPLIGGSGASGVHSRWSGGGGGAGGGAILIACKNSILIRRNGNIGGIFANGGSGQAAGSGGAIRLVAQTVNGDGYLLARPGSYFGDIPDAGGAGRICVEATDAFFTGTVDPGAMVVQPVQAAPPIWPDAGTPKVSLLTLGGQSLPADPRGRFETGAFDLLLDQAGTQELRLGTENVPTTWTVQVKLTPVSGVHTRVNASFDSGTEASGIWKVNLDMGAGVSAIQARAYKP
jgi:hypothetical protein